MTLIIAHGGNIYLDLGNNTYACPCEPAARWKDTGDIVARLLTSEDIPELERRVAEATARRCPHTAEVAQEAIKMLEEKSTHR